MHKRYGRLTAVQGIDFTVHAGKLHKRAEPNGEPSLHMSDWRLGLMSEDTNVEKLASVLNNASQQGKDSFVRMLWKNQPADVQTEIMPLLTAEARQAIDTSSE